MDIKRSNRNVWLVGLFLATVAMAQDSTNFIPNGGFGPGAIPWYWNGACLSASRETTVYHSAPSCIRLHPLVGGATFTDDGVLTYLNDTVYAGRTLTFSFWARSGTAGTSKLWAPIREVRTPPWHDLFDTAYPSGGPETIDTNWRFCSISGIPVIDSVNLFRIEFEFPNDSTSVLLVDDVKLSLDPRTVAVTHERPLASAKNSHTIRNNAIHFGATTNYDLSVLSVNGQCVANRRGCGTAIDFGSERLHPGYYFVKGVSGIGEFSGGIRIAR